MRLVRRLVVLAALVLLVLPSAAEAGTTRTYPGCGATLAACMNAAPAGTTIRLRTNALIPVPETLSFTKALSLVAAPGFSPKVGRTSTPSFIEFDPAESPAHLTFRGIRFRQAGISVEWSGGSGHSVVFEKNHVTFDTGSNGDHGLSLWYGGTSAGSMVVRNNVISSSGQGMQLRAQGGPATITGNRLTTPKPIDSGGGIELNAGAGVVKALVANNLIYGDVAGCGCGSPTGIRLSAYLTGELDLRLLNNTVANLTMAEPTGILIDAFAPGTVDARIFNNTVSRVDTGIILGGAGIEAVGDRNNSYQVPDGDSLGAHPMGTVLHVAPGFRNAAGGDYRLRAASALRNAGRTCIDALPLPRGDLAGRFRLAGRAVDVGAYEQGSTLGGGIAGKNLSGADLADTLIGTSGVDVICGLSGKDRLEGRGRGDFLFGGTGADRLLGGDGPDLIDARDGAPADRVNGGRGRDTCLRDGGDIRASCP